MCIGISGSRENAARWLCVDPGEVRTGVALGNTYDRIASPLEVIERPAAGAIERILELAQEYNTTGIVVGWPLNMDDTEGPQAKTARKLAAELCDRSKLDVRLWDERLSSFQADQEIAGKYTRKGRRKRQDAVAAAAILQDFFARNGPQVAQRP
jgi:putative Holliday junction resolvase